MEKDLFAPNYPLKVAVRCTGMIDEDSPKIIAHQESIIRIGPKERADKIVNMICRTRKGHA
jgi:hypothetical protein